MIASISLCCLIATSSALISRSRAAAEATGTTETVLPGEADGFAFNQATDDSFISNLQYQAETQPSAGASGSTTILPSGFGAIAVDPSTGNVFVSSPTDGTVTELSSGGAPLGEVASLAGADALAIADGDLYVATNDAIVELSIPNLATIQSFGAGTLNSPGPIAIVDDTLWTTTGECDEWSTDLASINLQNGAVSTYSWGQDMPALAYCAGFIAGPPGSDQLLAWSSGQAPAELYEVSLASGAPTIIQSSRLPQGEIYQIALEPGNLNFVVASGIGGLEYNLATFAPTGVEYPSADQGVATTSAGEGAVAGLAAGEVDVFVPNQPGIETYHDDFVDPADEGLAYSPDGSTLYLVTGAPGSSRLHVITPSSADAIRAETITEVDEDGNVLGTITGAGGPISMLVANGDLYVSAVYSGSIDVYDASTLQLIGQLGSGSLIWPGTLAITDGKIWTGSGYCAISGTNETLAAVDLSSGAVQRFSLSAVQPNACIGLLVADPSNSSDLLEADVDSTSINRIDVAESPPVTVQSVTQLEPGTSNIEMDAPQEVAFPSNSTMLEPDGSLLEANLSTLELNGTSYRGPAQSVFWSSAQGGLIAETSAGPDPYECGASSATVYSVGDDTPLLSYDFGCWESDVEDMVAITSDGSRFITVRQSYGSPNVFTLFTVPIPQTTGAQGGTPTTSTTTTTEPSTTPSTTINEPTTTVTEPTTTLTAAPSGTNGTPPTTVTTTTTTDPQEPPGVGEGSFASDSPSALGQSGPAAPVGPDGSSTLPLSSATQSTDSSKGTGTPTSLTSSRGAESAAPASRVELGSRRVVEGKLTRTEIGTSIEITARASDGVTVRTSTKVESAHRFFWRTPRLPPGRVEVTVRRRPVCTKRGRVTSCSSPVLMRSALG